MNFRIARARILYSHHIVVTVAAHGITGIGSGVLYRSTLWEVKRIWDDWLRHYLEEHATCDEAHAGLPARLAVAEPGLAFAVDTALLDWRSRQQGISFGQLLGRPWTTTIPITEQVFIEEPQAGRAALEEIRGRGVTRLKVKIGFNPAHDLALIRDLTAQFGKSYEIRVDANRAYPLAGSIGLYRALAESGVLAAEEPINDRAWGVLHRFRAETGLPVLLDESVLTLDDLRAAIEAGALDILNIKLSRVGGVSRGLEYIRLCQAAGIGVSVGCSEDLGPGMAAILHLSAVTAPLYSTEGMGYLRLGADMIVEPMPVQGGEARVPDGPGLGVTLRPTFPDGMPANVVCTDLTADSNAAVRARSTYMRGRQRIANVLYRTQRRLHRAR